MAATLELTAKEDVTEKLFKLEQQNLRLIEQNKRLAQESRRAHKESADGLSKVSGYLQAQVGDLKNVALGLVGGGGVVGAVTATISAYSKWQDELKNLGKGHKDFTDRLVGDLMRSRDAAQAAEIEAWGRGQLKHGATEEQAQRLLAGVTSEMQTSPLARREAIAEAIMPTLKVLPAAGEQAEVARIAGQFGGMFPEKSPQEIAGLAVGLRQLPEVTTETLTGDAIQRVVSTWQKAGLSGEEAVARLLVAVEKGQRRPGALIAAAEAVDKQMDTIKPSRGHRILTAEERAKNRFAEASPAERIRLLDTDREVRDAVLGDQGLMFSQITAEETAEKLRQMRRMEQPEFIPRQIETIGRSAAGAKTIAGQQQTLRTYSAQEEDRRRGERLERAEARFSEFQAGRGAMDRFWNRWAWIVSRTVNPENPEQELVKRGFARPGYAEIKDMAARAAEEEKAIAEAERQTKQLERQNHILERIEQNTKPRPSAAAVQQNLRQHGEN
jgi:hypothetical protein